MKKIILFTTTALFLTFSSALFASVDSSNEKEEGEYQSHASQNQHQIKILNHGLASLYERIQLIENAKQSIDMEYFIFNNDASGNLILKKPLKNIVWPF